MDWCTLIEIAFILYLAIQLLRLVLSDCDLQLQWAEKFGKSTGDDISHFLKQQALCLFLAMHFFVVVVLWVFIPPTNNSCFVFFLIRLCAHL